MGGQENCGLFLLRMLPIAIKLSMANGQSWDLLLCIKNLFGWGRLEICETWAFGWSLGERFEGFLVAQPFFRAVYYCLTLSDQGGRGVCIALFFLQLVLLSGLPYCIDTSWLFLNIENKNIEENFKSNFLPQLLSEGGTKKWNFWKLVIQLKLLYDLKST